MSRNQDKTYRCPVTGLEIAELKEFTNVDFGNGYYFSIKKIGDSIIYFNSRGNMKFSDVNRHYELTETFIKKAKVKRPFIEIRDYKNLTGRATSLQKDIQKNYLNEHVDDFAGVIVCNIPEWLWIFLRITPKLFSTHLKIDISKNYNNALLKAVKILQTNDKAFDGLRYDNIIIKQEWGFENEDFKLINGIIPQKLFFTSFQGNVHTETVNKVSKCMSRLFEEGHLTGSEYIRIADYSQLTNVPLKIRNVYAKTINNLNLKYNCNPIKTYVCGANSFVRIAMRLYTSIVKQKFIFVDSVETAFSEINGESRQLVPDKKNIKVSQDDVEEIINLSSSLIWGETEIADVRVSNNNPLKQLAATLSLIQEDLINLRLKEKSYTIDLQESLKNSEQLAGDLKASNEESLQLNEELIATNEKLHDQKKELEEARNQLIEMNTNLETMVENRTKKWKKSVKILNKTVDKLDRFVYSASHDLSAPLKSMAGLLNIIKIDSNKDQIFECLRYIENSIHKLEEVIKNLLSYSRNTRLEVKNESFNLYDLTNEVIIELAYLPKAGLIDFNVNMPDSQIIVTDKQRLKVILQNLINNCIKYADLEKAKPKVVINLKEDNERYRIFVKDNGQGIEKDQIKKIFRMFYRATENAQGSGLGLFIVDEAVTALSGKIKVKSKPGVDTVVVVTLPKPV